MGGGFCREVVPACLPACLPLVEWNPRIVRDHTGSWGGRGQSPQRWLTIHTVHLLRGSAPAQKAWGFKRNLASVKKPNRAASTSENVQITKIWNAHNEQNRGEKRHDWAYERRIVSVWRRGTDYAVVSDFFRFLYSHDTTTYSIFPLHRKQS